MNKRCECPTTTNISPMAEFIDLLPEEEKARAHEANECPGDYGLALYKRGNKKLYLCSFCNLIGDVLQKNQ